MKKPELLAPAGSMESLKASVQAGCDAVYLGGELFGARAFAKNLTKEDLLYAIDYVHRYDRKIYLTVNTLVKEAELKDQLYSYLQPYYLQGLDAVIVQDTGVLAFLSEYFPKLPVHLSTQMTINRAEAAEFYKESTAGKNITRFVPSRELTLHELKIMRQKTDLELEVFIHGALCYCYSGQCLMSSMIGGRSGNRGRCAQPCRMPYQVERIDGKKVTAPGEYLLSPKDICTLESIPDLMEIGVDSFKIEGRMKRFEYAAGVTAIYKKVIDRCLEIGTAAYKNERDQHPETKSKDQQILMELYNRGSFSQGYLKEEPGPSMMSMVRPNHNGIKVGTVQKLTGIQAEISLETEVSPQDVLEIRGSQENAVYEFTVGKAGLSGTVYNTNVKPKAGVTVGQEVYRTKNTVLLQEIEENYLLNEKKLPITGRLKVIAGQPMELHLQHKETTCVVFGETVQHAQNRPLSEDDVRKQLVKTKDSPFEFDTLDIAIDGAGFLPVSKLNELRRDALDRLETTIVERFRRSKLESLLPAPFEDRDRIENLEEGKDVKKGLETEGFLVLVSKKEQLLPVLTHERTATAILDITEISLDSITDMIQKCREYEKKCYLAFPRILREDAIQTKGIFSKRIHPYESLLFSEAIDGVLLRNMEEVAYIKSINFQKEILLDSMLYVMNSKSKEFWKQNGNYKLTAPLELNANELKDLRIKDMSMIIYGRIPLMISAQCLYGNCEICKKKNSGAPIVLIDRMGKRFPVQTDCINCQSVVYNTEIYSLFYQAEEVKELQPQSLRLDFTLEDMDEVLQIMNMASNAYFAQDSGACENPRGATKGHFHRGVQ